MNISPELSTFDKINLASCAAARANDNALSDERFSGEFQTVILWKGHRVIQTHVCNEPYGYMARA
jgi:hypothetical protein